MKPGYIALCVAVVCSLAGCRQRVAPEVKEVLGSTLNVTEQVENSLNDIFKKHEYVFVNYIGLKDCVSCMMSRQAKLSYRKYELADLSTGVLLVLEDNDRKTEISELISDMHIDFDYVFDENNMFRSANPLMAENPLCDMCLIDKKREIIWLGSPIQNSESMERYRKLMTELLKR